MIIGAQVIRDVAVGQEALLNFTADQQAVAYRFTLAEEGNLQIEVTYLGASFPLMLEVYQPDGTLVTTQPIEAADTYVLSLTPGPYRLLFAVDTGVMGRATVLFKTADGGTVTTPNPTPDAASTSSGDTSAQPTRQTSNTTQSSTDMSGAQTTADQDNDGVPDSEDVCSATPGNPANAGCPLATGGNSQGDPTAASLAPTQAPTEAAGDLSLMPLEVTPVPDRPSDVDRDGDSVPDNIDACPDEAGTATSTGASDHGCPSGASGGFLPEPGEYTFTSVREGCYGGRMTEISENQAYESFMFITHGADGNSIVVSFEGKENVIFTRGTNSPQFFQYESQLIADLENSRRIEAFVFDKDPIEYYDLSIDPRDTSCYAITYYELARVSDAITREERAENMQTGSNNTNVNTGGTSSGTLPSGSYQADLSQSGRGCEESEVLFPDSGVSMQFTVEAAPNGTDLVVTSENGQTVTFVPDGANTYAADDGSLRLVITVENGTITRYAEYELSGDSCEVTRVYEMQQTGELEQTAEETEPSSDGPDFAEIDGQPISEGEWVAVGELAGIGCPGAEEWNAVTANSMDLDFNFSLAFTPQGVEATQTGTTLLEPTGEPNTFRFDETTPPPYIEIIQFDSPDSGTLSRYMNPNSCAGAFRWIITYAGN